MFIATYIRVTLYSALFQKIYQLNRNDEWVQLKFFKSLIILYLNATFRSFFSNKVSDIFLSIFHVSYDFNFGRHIRTFS